MESDEDKSYKELLFEMIGNIDYILLMLSLTGFFFITSGVQYWAVNYM